MNRPSNLNALKRKIQNLEQNQLAETQRVNLMALVVLSQMLPEGAVKGGSAMAFRYGPGARMTSDLDAARKDEEEQFIESLEANLDSGWQGFTGRVKPRKKPKPFGVPAKYIMAPFDIKLQYEGRDWKTILFELGHSELGAADSDEYHLSDELSNLFTELGFAAPKPVRVLKAEHQIAQKIHAATLPGSPRAHDLVDLQIILAQEAINFSLARKLCEATFAYRGDHSWPASFVKNEGWETTYEKAAEALDLPGVPIRSMDSAISWGNELIHQIATAQK